MTAEQRVYTWTPMSCQSLLKGNRAFFKPGNRIDQDPIRLPGRVITVCGAVRALEAMSGDQLGLRESGVTKMAIPHPLLLTLVRTTFLPIVRIGIEVTFALTLPERC